jgi:hypothetical protein
MGQIDLSFHCAQDGFGQRDSLAGLSFFLSKAECGKLCRVG